MHQFPKLFILSSLLAAAAMASPYTIAPEKSELTWHATKVTGQHNGTIALKSGSLDWNDSTLSGGKFEINMSSIKVLDVKDPKFNKDLTEHLKSDDFFSAQKHPVGIFEITKATKVSGNEFNIEGNLSIKGVSQPIQFPATVETADNTLKISGKAVLDRTRWGIKYKSGKFIPNLGDKLIHDNFDVAINLVATATAPVKAKKAHK